MVTVEKVKAHCRITHSLEDGLIQDYLNFAEYDVIEAIFDSRDPNLDKEGLKMDLSYQKAVLMLAAYYYENRSSFQEVTKSGGIQESPMAVIHAIQTLRAHRDRYLL